MMRLWVVALAAVAVIGSGTVAVADASEDCSNAEVLLKTDPARTVSACQELAKLGDALAQNNLGSMYFQSRGVSWSYKEAAKWYRQAAEQGYAAAQCNLGIMYSRGEGVRSEE